MRVNVLQCEPDAAFRGKALDSFRVPVAGRGCTSDPCIYRGCMDSEMPRQECRAPDDVAAGIFRFPPRIVKNEASELGFPSALGPAAQMDSSFYRMARFSNSDQLLNR
jgi:hypothetical protein